jgi:hypothetical protein
LDSYPPRRTGFDSWNGMDRGIKECSRCCLNLYNKYWNGAVAQVVTRLRLSRERWIHIRLGGRGSTRGMEWIAASRNVVDVV